MSVIDDKLKSAIDKLQDAVAGKNILMNTYLPLRDVLGIAANKDFAQTPVAETKRVVELLTAVIPVVTKEVGTSLSEEHIRFAIEAAIGLTGFFGGAHDGVPRYDLDAIVHDHLDWTALIAAELEALECRRCIECRGDVLRYTARAIADRPEYDGLSTH